jgi:hypothetical protein
LSEVDELFVCLYIECQETIDIQEVSRYGNLLEKENINIASQCLAPNPQSLPRSGNGTHNPLSAISREVPALVNEVSPKFVGTKKTMFVLL